MKIRRLGHSMFLITDNKGNNYLTDPYFSGNPGCPSKYMSTDFLKTIKAAFVTHGHMDHASGIAELKVANPDAIIVCCYELGISFMQDGYSNVYLMNYGASIAVGDLTVSMVMAEHTSSYKELQGPPIFVGEAAGYVFDIPGEPKVYYAGDTAMFMDMKLIQDFYKPDIAILPVSGQFTMGPKEAAYALNNLLNVKYAIPCHTFPNEQIAPNPEALKAMLQQFPFIQGMMNNKDYELKELFKVKSSTEVVIMGYGDEKDF